MGHPKTKAGRLAAHFEKDRNKDFFGREYTVQKHRPRRENLVYCPASRKEKLRFETETKAYRYIEYNSERISIENGYAPIRAYWCKECGCWHVTSKKKHHRKKMFPPCTK